MVQPTSRQTHAPAGLPVTSAILAGRNDGPSAGYVILATKCGSGSSAWNQFSLTNWAGPGAAGLRFFVRDLDSGIFWNIGQQDDNHKSDIQASWKPGIFKLEHTENNLQTVCETCVLSDRSAELRKITLTNLSENMRNLDLTSLAEIVLNQADAHTAHPAFSKLFLQTRYVPQKQCLLVQRRPRDSNEHHPVLVHAIIEKGDLEFETDRTVFHGRGNNPARPAALAGKLPLSGKVGNVLDPVVSFRRKFKLDPGQSTTVTFLLGVASDETKAIELTSSINTSSGPSEMLAAANLTIADQLARHHMSHEEHVYAQHLAVAIFRNDPRLRAAADQLARAAGNPADLAFLGISTRQPLVVVDTNPDLTAVMLHMFHIWRLLSLPIQMVVITDEKKAVVPEAQLLQFSRSDITKQQQDLLSAMASLVVTKSLPGIEGLAAPERQNKSIGNSSLDVNIQAPKTPYLKFFNGFGGFSENGKEYVIQVSSKPDGSLRLPPLPWTNVLSNDQLGCIVSETGAGATWYGNSRENRLTPWLNDPLLDPHGDAIYLRDDTTKSFFSCFPGPVPAGGNYTISHGHGYTRCERSGADLTVETLVFVDKTEPMRLTRISVTNSGAVSYKLSLFTYNQLVLGGIPEESSRFVKTSYDEVSGAMLAHNRTAGPFAAHTAFAALVSDGTISLSGDGAAFIGAGSDLAAPAVMSVDKLNGRTGAGLDPCFAMQTSLTVNPGETGSVWLIFGQTTDDQAATDLINTLAEPDACNEAWITTRDFWSNGLSSINVQTPSPTMDLMVNGWLSYQTLACRMQGRSAMYQSGGAFGFRDQLQDSLSLMQQWPEITRRQILLHAAHQFVEGDVLHWWHPPLSRGIRTRFADDLLWLPFATMDYLNTTGDQSILKEQIPFLTAQTLKPGQDEVFLQPEPAGVSGDLYDHCCRALDRSLTHGAHGLPLFGTGDWNDGMNRVGREGRGESVWMGFFLVTIINRFLPLCKANHDADRTARYQQYRDEMVHTLNDSGWDGDWYRRGYYDNGSPLGSWENKECAIDALAQAWSVLSGVASPARADRVMDAVEEHLISDDDRLIRLLTPPFVDTENDPGYIKGYVAGVRENGGQYTHAAMWVVKAMATLGRRNRAAKLLELVNPIEQACTPEQVARYQVEPYVVAADVYGAAPHVGRGGWTWYTGSSGWMFRVALESVLGLQAAADLLVIAPCVPDDWPFYSINWRVPDNSDKQTSYKIEVNNPDHCSESVVAVICDGIEATPVNGQAQVPLLRDGNNHTLVITLGPAPVVDPAGEAL